MGTTTTPNISFQDFASFQEWLMLDSRVMDLRML
jgi:hypothetical protein